MKKAVLLLSLITIFFTANAQDEWELINPYPTLTDFQDAHFTSEQEGWVIGYNVVMFTNDGGDTWETQLSTDGEALRRIVFVDENEGWVLGYKNIYHTINAGNTWELETLPEVIGSFNDVFFINNDIGWIVGSFNIVLKTIDGGETWTKLFNSTPSNTVIESVSFSDELNGCAVGSQYSFYLGFIMTTNDGGHTWTVRTPSDHSRFNKVTFVDSVTGWVCGISGELMKTEDGGNTWIDKSFFYYQRSFNDIHFFDSLKGVLLDDEYMRLTFDAGETWDSIVNIDYSSYQHSISSWAYEKLVTVGSNGSIVMSLDGGSTWENINKGITSDIYQLGFINSFDGYAISGQWYTHELLITNNGGYTWKVDTIIENGPFYRMFVDGESIYLLNDFSQLMKTNNGGDDWELLEVPNISSDYSDIQFVTNNIGFMCYSNGLLLKTMDGGHTWVDKSLNGNYNLSSLFFINENTGWMFDTQARVVLRTTNGGDDWEFTFLGDYFDYQPQSIFFVNENLGYATTTEGILFKTFDGGINWEEFSFIVGSYTSKCYFINELEGWYTVYGVIYHTFDGGTTWINQQGLDATINDMFFLNNQGWLGGNNGLVATTNFTVNINELEENIPSATVFPNPASDEIEVKLHDKSDKINDIKVFNLQGKLVYHFENILENNTFSFNVSKMVSGAYVIHISSSNGENLVKFVIQ
ncbi:MAG: YCF48-related protein [Bacteroidota bacterium]